MIHVLLRVPHFFKLKYRLQRKLEELYLTSAIIDFASSAITLFEPIYLWTLGYRIQELMFFYLMVYVAYFVLAPLGGKFIARFGPERSIMLSTFWLVLYFVALIGISRVHQLFVVAPLFLALQKTFYWPAYHFDFIRFSEKKERTSEFSGLWAITTLMYVLGPLTGGFVVKYFGFTPLFLGAAVVILLSSIPMFTTNVSPKREAFSYWNSLLLPFRRRYWHDTLAYLSLGNELVLLTIWPVFIMLIFGDLFNVGALVGLSALVTATVTLAAGKWADRSSKHHVLGIGALVTAGVWVLRVVSRLPVFVFLLDIFGRFGYNTAFVTMTAMTYDRAHPDDYAYHGVYYEQGYAIAKSLMACAVIIVASVFDPFEGAFALAAVTSLLYLAF